MIEVENLSRRYGEKLAVDGLDFVVQPGVVTGPPAARLSSLVVPATGAPPAQRPPGRTQQGVGSRAYGPVKFARQDDAADHYFP